MSLWYCGGFYLLLQIKKQTNQRRKRDKPAIFDRNYNTKRFNHFAKHWITIDAGDTATNSRSQPNPIDLSASADHASEYKPPKITDDQEVHSQSMNNNKNTDIDSSDDDVYSQAQGTNEQEHSNTHRSTMEAEPDEYKEEVDYKDDEDVIQYLHDQGIAMKPVPNTEDDGEHNANPVDEHKDMGNGDGIGIATTGPVQPVMIMGGVDPLEALKSADSDAIYEKPDVTFGVDIDMEYDEVVYDDIENENENKDKAGNFEKVGVERKVMKNVTGYDQEDGVNYGDPQITGNDDGEETLEFDEDTYQFKI